MTAVVLRGDAALLPLPDASVDLIVTSPPYWSLRDYRDGGESLKGQIGSEETWQEYLANLLTCTREWVRVLKPSGSIFVNIGDKYANDAKWGGATSGKHVDGLHGKTGIGRAKVRTGIPAKSLIGLPARYALACVDDLGLIWRRDNIWHKNDGMPESVDDRCATKHEYVHHLTVQPRYFSAVDEIREPHVKQDSGNRSSYAPGSSSGYVNGSRPAKSDAGLPLHPLGRLPGSVWTIQSAPLIVPEHLRLDHFAAYPPELCRRIILGWSPSGICLECGEGRRPVANAVRTIAGKPAPGLGGWKRSRRDGTTSGIGNYRFGTDRRITGYTCACTPRISNYGKRGDWKTGREEMAEHRSDDWHTPGNAVPRRPGGFGTKVPPPDAPLWQYDFENWAPAPTRPAVVLDPFGGTGTTALVADVFGRTGITVDRSADYCRLARWRTSDPGERARALGVPKPPPVPEGQGSLFDHLETGGAA